MAAAGATLGEMPAANSEFVTVFAAAAAAAVVAAVAPKGAHAQRAQQRRARRVSAFHALLYSYKLLPR